MTTTKPMRHHRSVSSSYAPRRLKNLVLDNQRLLRDLISEQSHVIPLEPSFRDYLKFELRYSLPGIVSLALYCLAHAAAYELVSDVLYQSVDKLESTTSVFGLTVLLGFLLARLTGILWNFVPPNRYKCLQFDLHLRQRVGMSDSLFLHTLKEGASSAVKGALSLVAFYMVYITVLFGLHSLALCVDQRMDIVAAMPSQIFQREKVGYSSIPEKHIAHHRVYVHQDLVEDEYEAFGTADDRYLYRELSKNSYENFFGLYYETAMFSTFFHLLFYATVFIFSLGFMRVKKFSFLSTW